MSCINSETIIPITIGVFIVGAIRAYFDERAWTKKIEAGKRKYKLNKLNE